jgi:ATP-binding cassette, subfamily B, bacterial
VARYVAAPAPSKKTPKNLKERLSGSFSQTSKTLALVWQTSRGATLLFASLTLIAALVPLSIAYIGKHLIDAVVAGDADTALRFVLFELGLVMSQALLFRGLSLCRSLLGARLALRINLMILEKTQRLSLSHFEDAEFYDQLTRARREASVRPISVISELFQLIQNSITLTGYVALLIGFSGWVVLGLLVDGIPATIVEMKFSGTAFRLRNWRSQDARRQNYLEYVLANDTHAKEVKMLDLGPLLLERYRKQGEVFYLEDRALAFRRAFWAYLLSLLATATFYGSYALMAIAAAMKRLSLGEMTLYIAAFRQGQQSFQSILAAIGGMYEDNLYMSNLFEFLAIDTSLPLTKKAAPNAGATALTPPIKKEDLQAEPQPQAEIIDVKGSRGFVLQDVGFQYPNQDRWALRHINLQIPEGTSVAFVGQNGAGKTTMIKLLTRLYQPTEGAIFLDGRDLNEWPEEDLKRRLSVVFQDFNQYQFSAKENIGLGSVPHKEDSDRIQRATARGGAEELISTLKEGIDTQLGKWFNGGISLSGGQWQKIALSRAFMREEADLLILDEPTAALDAEAEHLIFERFRTLAKGRTSILISHRFPTVRMADKIFVIENGTLQESGSHQELVEANGRYARLFALQAQGYL